ncbi:MAG: hypothetical protein RIT39_941 [Bacteroidota bacterium]
MTEHLQTFPNPCLLELDDELYAGPPWQRLELPPQGLLLPESLRAYRSSETEEVLPDRDTARPDQALAYFDALIQKGPRWEAWVADFPRSTWMPLGLVSEWGWGSGRRGLVQDPDSTPGLRPLFESVCGPLGGEALGWQAWPAFQAVQIFALPQPWHHALAQNPTLGPVYSSSVLWTAFWQHRIAASDSKTRQIALLIGQRDASIWVMEPHKLCHHGRYLISHSHDILFHLLRQKEEHGASVLHFAGSITEDPELRAALEGAFEQVFAVGIEGAQDGAINRLECLQEGLRLWQAACE